MTEVAEQESKTPSERLALTDVGELLPACLKKKTVTKKDFVDHMGGGRTFKPKKIFKYQTDGALISGHYANNLKVNSVEEKTRTWPYAMDWREEYKQFLLRTKWCNENIYKLFFESPPVRYDQIEDFLRDLRKTVYGSDYSPNEYVSLNSQKTIKTDIDDPNCTSQDIQTTYGNYYNRLQELNKFGANLYRGPAPKDLSMDKFAENMRKIFRKYELSTYFEEICVPALMTAKDGKMPTGPIDRYTLRRY
ncbi:uncharacterized protein LOC6568519 [Drosophila grimshawi]|uniref:GH16277 n=1 Tax=Drosophila grimshawi TaxID=7222 RepID=B4JU94_DROGR|nr:uncharacterized protein LOC6568519 [Drosophila grimshawi]EDV91064.1 GH16277 [Drosophila grimshawi]